MGNRLQVQVFFCLALAAKAGAVLTNIGMPANGKLYYAGEIATNATYTYGRYEAVFKSSQGSGLVSALFTYASVPVAQANEIDIENLGRYNDQVQFNVFSYNNVGHPQTLVTCFNPHAAFHHYAIESIPGRISWFIDGVQVYSDARPYIAAEMVQPQHFMLNHWPSNSGPGWAGNIDNAALPANMVYDWAAYASHTPGAGNTGSGFNFTAQWRDDFNAFDSARWYRSNNTTFGGNAGNFVAQNVVYQGGLLYLTVTQAPWAGFNDVVPTLNATPSSYCNTPAPSPTRSFTNAPTATVTPTLTPPSVLIIDDFSSDAQYNTSHLNDFGRWTSDDGSAALAQAAGGALALSVTASSYWYSGLSSGLACYDATAFGGISFRVRGAVGGETFAINLRDGSGTCAASSPHYVSSPLHFTVTTSWQTVILPFSLFGVNAAGLASLGFESFSSGTLYFDDLALVATVPFTPSFTRSPSPSRTRTLTPAATLTGTPSSTATRTPSASPSTTLSRTPSPSRTASLTLSLTSTASQTGTRSLTPTQSASRTATLSSTLSLTATPSQTQVPPGSSPTASPSASASQSPTLSFTASSSPTASRSATSSSSPTASATPSGTLTATSSASSTQTVSPTWTPAATGTRTASPSGTPSLTSTFSPTPSATASRTSTLSASATQSATSSPSATPSGTPQSSVSPTQTSTVPLPTPGDGELKILACLPYPHPNPLLLKVLLAGPAQSLALRIYSPGMSLVAAEEHGPRPAGWADIPLPPGLSNGLFYYRLTARRDGQEAAAPPGKLLWLR